MKHCLGLFLLLISLQCDSYAATLDVEALSKNFINKLAAKSQPSASEADIDAYLHLFSDDFIDDHVKSNFQFKDKAQLKKALMRKLDDEVHYLRVDINKEIFGRTNVFMQITTSAKVKPFHLDSVIEHSTTSLISIEFDDKGLIKRIMRFAG